MGVVADLYRPLTPVWEQASATAERCALSLARGQEAICMSQTYLACMSHLRRLRQVDPEKEVSACLSIPHDLHR